MAQQQQQNQQQYPSNGGRGRGGGRQPYPNYAATTAGRGPRVPMGAWQPAQPTQYGVPPPPPHYQQQQQQQQSGPPGSQQQQPQQSHQQPPQPRVGMPPQHQPYMQQQIHQQQNYYNPYSQPNPYAPRGGVPQWQGQPAYPGMRGGVFYPQNMPQQPVSTPVVVPPPVREKKPLLITDRSGKPIDLGNVASKKTATTAAEDVTPAIATPSPPEKKEDAGAKLLQAALQRIEADKIKETEVVQKAEEKSHVEIQDEKDKKVMHVADDPPSLVEEKTSLPSDTSTNKSSAPTAAAEENATPPVIAKQEEMVNVLPEVEFEKTSILSPEATPDPEMKETSIVTATQDEKMMAIETSAQVSSTGHRVYTKEELLKLKDLSNCRERPKDLPDMNIVVFEARADKNRGGGGGGGVDRTSGGGAGPRRASQRGEGSDQWARGSAPPRRQSSTGETRIDSSGGSRGGGRNDGNSGTGGRSDGAGNSWSRGQEPPRPQPNQKGDNRGNDHRGDRGGHHQQPLYDGPVAPLVKSENHWRPSKNSSPFAIAEKRVKAILNKMTKEKFDHLSEQMLEIPILSYETLTMIIDNVYDKAIDEPMFGDMYASLCVRLSERVQGNQFVHIIESDEEPPTDDGQIAAEPIKEESNNTVYRWSHDIGTSDSEIVGPFSSPEGCMNAAFSEEEIKPIERGEMELELVSAFIKRHIFIKIMKKKDLEEGEEDIFYTVYFPASAAEDCGQQLSGIFLSEVECNSDAKKVNSFKPSLLNKCEEEFRKQDIYADWVRDKAEFDENRSNMMDAERAEKEEELNFRRIRIKKQMLGNVQFIGQLYKVNLLREKIMRYCIASTLQLTACDKTKSKNREYVDSGMTDKMDEEDHEAICSMFTTIGATIDKPIAATFMSVCFEKIAKLSTAPELPARSKFMYKDLLDLRKNQWIPRRKIEKAKTIAEIRKDVEQERLQAEMNRSGGDYRGDRNGGDFRRSSANSSSRNARPKPATTTDDEGFVTVATTAGRSLSGPKGAVKGQPNQDASFKSSATGGKPMFAVLSEENLSSAKTSAAASSVSTSLSEEKLEQKIKSMRNDFVSDGGNVEELMLTWDEMKGTPGAGKELVTKNIDRMMDCKENERVAIQKIIAILSEKGKLTKSDVQESLIGVMEYIDSMIMDSPRVYEYVGELLGELLRIKMFDMVWLCDLLEQPKEIDPNTEAPVKLLRFAFSVIKQSADRERVKALLSEQKLVGLLGADKLDALRHEF